MSSMEKDAKEIEKAFAALTKQFEDHHEENDEKLSYVR